MSSQHPNRNRLPETLARLRRRATALAGQNFGHGRTLSAVLVACLVVAAAVALFTALPSGSTRPSLAQLPQFARPVTPDVSTGGWTLTPLWDKLDEVAADDATSEIQSGADPVVADTFEVSLSPVTDPQSSIGHIVRYRMHRSGDKTTTVNVALFQGTTQIAADVTQTLTDIYQTFSFTLSGAEADAITNYADLRVRVSADVTGLGVSTSALATWIELEVPEPPATPTNTPTDTPTNTATDTPTFTPADTPTNTPTVTPTVAGPDLVVTNTDAPDPVTAGQALAYTIRPRNIGSLPASQVQVVDVPPANFTYTGFSTDRGTCTLHNSITGGTLECDLGSFGTGSGAVATITVVGYISSSVNTSVINTATVDPNGLVAESSESNNIAQATTQITGATPTFTPTTSQTKTATRTPTPVPGTTSTATNTATATATAPAGADLEITNVDSPDPVVGGFPLTYTIQVRNRGGLTANPVRFVDQPPVNFFYSTFNTTAGTCTVGGSLLGGELSCDLGSMAPSATVTITVVGSVYQAGNVTNTAIVDPYGEVAEADESNNQAVATTQINPPPTATATPLPPPGDLAVTITDTIDPVLVNQPFAYQIVITNIGTTPVGTEIDFTTGAPVGVYAQDQLPVGFTIAGFSTDHQGTCELRGTLPSVRVFCQYSVFAPSDTATILINGWLTAVGTIPNTVFVDLPNNLADEAVEIANNIATTDTTVLSPTATATPTRTATATPTSTGTPTSTPTVTSTPTHTPTATPCPTEGCPTATPTPTPLPCADLTGDGIVLASDITFVVLRYGTSDPLADVDGSGLVLSGDITLVVLQYGLSC